MAVTYKEWREMLPLPYMSIMLHYTFQQGQLPSFPQVYNVETVSPVEFWSPVNRSPSLIELKMHDGLDNYIKRGWNKHPTRRFVPVKFKKETLYPKMYYLSKQTLGASGRLTMKAHVQWLLWLRMVTNTHVLWMLVQSRNTLSKK